MFRISSKEGLFFDLFIESVQASCLAAEKLESLMDNYTNIEEQINFIEQIEHEGDHHVHRILEQLNKSFITPIDREDIYLIAKELDNITDSIESTAHRFRMLNVTSIRDDAKRLASLIVQCTKELKYLMSDLKNMKRSCTLQEKVIEVNRIENVGDDIFRNAITGLFASEKDPIELIKWKEIFEYLENTLDACEEVANIAEGIIMKHA